MGTERIDGSELAWILVHMDAEFYYLTKKIFGLAGEKFMDRLRFYQKLIIHVTGICGEMAEILGLTVDEVEESTRKAYEEWKSR